MLADVLQFHQAAHPGIAVAVVVSDACCKHVGDDLVFRGDHLFGEKQAARQDLLGFIEGGTFIHQQAVENIQRQFGFVRFALRTAVRCLDCTLHTHQGMAQAPLDQVKNAFVDA
ncbi:hypothetical protein D3C78_1555160 [compost metagenome]